MDRNLTLLIDAAATKGWLLAAHGLAQGAVQLYLTVRDADKSMTGISATHARDLLDTALRQRLATLRQVLIEDAIVACDRRIDNVLRDIAKEARK